MEGKINADYILSQYPAEQKYMLDVLHDFQETYGYISSDHIRKIAEHFRLSMANVFSEITFYDKFVTEKPGTIVFEICDGTVCHSQGGRELLACLEQKLGIKPGETTDDGLYSLRTVRCMGACEHAPVMVVDNEVCGELAPADLEKAISDEPWGVPKLKQNKNADHINLIRCKYEPKLLSPISTIEEYIIRGGFDGMKRAFEFPQKRMILEELKKSRLRGRSGSGFPVGDKWEAAYNAKGRSSNFIDKYVVANGDEGDPGAFMDRWLMENNPYLILEGMVIAGRCINANIGYIYVRDEYETAIIKLEKALAEMRRMNLLGRNILHQKYSFDIKVIKAGRSYVCGEESALMESIEGKPGTPRIKPPFPTYRGILEQPTLINNIETFANASLVLKEGGEEYSKTGTAQNTGTKIFSLSGAIRNKGLVEVPLGKVTLRELIYDIGGGVTGGQLKCVQTGGPSGGYLSGDDLDIILDFDAFAAKGHLLGSGGIIVINDSMSAIDIVGHIIEFLADESCGTCTPCREGLRILKGIMERMADKNGIPEDIVTMKKIASAAKIASRCALGKTIGNPILSMLQICEEEYREHMAERRQ